MQILGSCIKIRALPKTVYLQSTLQRCVHKHHEDAAWLAPLTALLLRARLLHALAVCWMNTMTPALPQMSSLYHPSPTDPDPGVISEKMLEDEGRAGQVVFWTRRGHSAHELTAVENSRVRFAQDQSRPNPSVDGIDDLQALPLTGEVSGENNWGCRGRVILFGRWSHLWVPMPHWMVHIHAHKLDIMD